MRKEFNRTITIFGTGKDIAEMEAELQGLDLSGSEGPNRLKLQRLIDLKGLKAEILYNGNSVWSYDKLVRNLKLILKARDIQKMNKYMYSFLHLCCGSIAHYNQHGWIATYPNVYNLAKFFRNNEYGRDIFTHQPGWKSDAQLIAKEFLNLTEGIV